MLSRESGVPVETLREAARIRVEETSLRVAASEIGMSHRGLEDFIGGTKPHASTAKKLTEWYLKSAAAGEFNVSTEIAQAALAVLTRYLPPERRAQAQARVVGTLGELAVEVGVPLPTWFEDAER
jgi:hypothetical protein